LRRAEVVPVRVSGDDFLNNEAYNMVERAATSTRLPGGFPEPFVEVTVTYVP
jgi:hypothetical protein